MSSPHGIRKHSKFSASGSERWFECPGSVEISEGLPDKTSSYALEGTKAHEILEQILRDRLGLPWKSVEPGTPVSMVQYGDRAAQFIVDLADRTPDSEILVETRVTLDFIHPEMFGTFDAAVIDHFGTLHVFDYKYGAGIPVSPKENLQMIFYGMGLAHTHHWNFKRVRLWIIQPRIKNYDGPLFWDIPIQDLKAYVGRFKQAVDRVLKEPDTFVEGSWCHWCKAKSICPLKRTTRYDQAKSVFLTQPKRISHGSEKEDGKEESGPKEEALKSEASWRKEARTQKRRARR